MPLNNENRIKYWGKNSPVCPFCDTVYDVYENEDYELLEEGWHYADCPKCEREFRTITRVKYFFDTGEQPHWMPLPEPPKEGGMI
jgi:hypothetical protein